MWPGGASDQIARGRDDAIARVLDTCRERELHTATHPHRSLLLGRVRSRVRLAPS